MTTLICGSLAYDTVMVFDGRFRDHILPDRIHVLNVAFLVPSMRRNYGGTAGNIAYNFKLLGGRARIMATVGEDFAPYAAWLDRCDIERKLIRPVAEEFTAQAFITTDQDNNQITAFHPGAMNHAHANVIDHALEFDVAILAPDGRQGMLEHAEQLAGRGARFVFDPGQGLPMFDGEALRSFIERSTWVAVNDYEASLLSERTGWSHEQIAERVEALVVTRGAHGSWIYAGGRRHDIDPVKPVRICDPTGCGDAYRAGLLYGIELGLDWPTIGRIASLMGAIKIEHHGTQQHGFTREEFAHRFRSAFGGSL